MLGSGLACLLLLKGFMGKLIPWSFQALRSGEQIQIPSFTNVAASQSHSRHA